MARPLWPAALLLLLAPAARPQEVAVAVEFRFVVDCASAGASPPVKDARRGESFCLAPKVIIDETDIDRAESTTGPMGDPGVELHLTDAGAKRLAAATENAVGQRLGVVVNSRLLAAPQIRAPLAQGIRLMGLSSPQEADDVARALNHKLPK
jgi:preprotein translocase subunit SecD